MLLFFQPDGVNKIKLFDQTEFTVYDIGFTAKGISKSKFSAKTRFMWIRLSKCQIYCQAAVVHLNFRAGSTFSVPVCTVSPGHWVNIADTQ